MILSLALVLSYGFRPLQGHVDAGPLRDRGNFARAWSHIAFGMSKEDVRTAIGKPDEQVTKESSIFSGPGSQWLYGTYRGFPTLGSVDFDSAGNVVSFEPTDGNVPKGLPEETVLRPALYAISWVCADRSPNELPYEFDGHTLVPVANELVEFGPEKAIAVLKEFMRLSPHTASPELYCLLRLVFQPRITASDFPRLMTIDSPAPEYYNTFPMYPFVLYGDVPFMIDGLQQTAGMFEPPQFDLVELARRCRFRKQPLTPSRRPWQVLSSKEVDSAFTNDFLTSQLLNALANAGRRPKAPLSPASWQDLDALPAGWAAELPTGSFPQKPVERVWSPSELSDNAKIVLRRLNDEFVLLRIVIRSHGYVGPWNELRCSISGEKVSSEFSLVNSERFEDSGQRIVERVLQFRPDQHMDLRLGASIAGKFVKRASWLAIQV